MTDRTAPSARLRREPGRYTLDAAVRVLQHEAGTADPSRAARFRAPVHLGYQGADVLAVEDGKPPVLVSGAVALTGAGGVLPRGYTEHAAAAQRERTPGLPAFLDLLASRLAAHFVAAGAKYRPHRAAEAAHLDGTPDPAGRVLLALAGHGLADMAERLDCGATPLMHYAGYFAAHPRSADRLAAMASDWLGRPVSVEQFAGTWLPIPPEERTRLGEGLSPGAFCQLGEAAVGVRTWDLHARVVLRVGPLDRATFMALLPGGKVLEKFGSLVRAYLGEGVGFAVNLVMMASELPKRSPESGAPGRLGSDTRLGWNMWLCGEREEDGAEPVFEGNKRTLTEPY